MCDWLQGELLPDVAIALPDADGIFEPPTLLCVNDAAWLPSDGVRLVHPAVPLHAAEALGAQSLRFHHQARSVASRYQCSNCLLAGSVTML